MTRIIVAVFLLCLSQIVFCAKPVFPEGQQFVYDYQGDVITHNVASNEHIAEWTVSGKLTIQSHKDHIIMKLDDLKRKLFNGLRANINDAEEHPIPTEANILLNPFIVHYYEDNDVENEIKVSHEPDEPLWSINMKRAIGSIFQVQESNQLKPDRTTYEASVYGVCQVTYNTVSLDDEKTVEKVLNYKTCEKRELFSLNNLKPRGNGSVIDVDVRRTYHYAKNNEEFVIKNVESESNVTYRMLPSAKNVHQIQQKQTFKLLETTKIESPIDVSKITENAKISFVYSSPDDDNTFGRNKTEKRDQTQLLEAYSNAFDKFEKYYKMVPLQNAQGQTTFLLDDIYEILSSIDGNLFDLGKLRTYFGENELKESVFISMLQYIGETSTMNFIKDAAVSDDLNDLMIMKLLATFPTYVLSTSHELVKSMEALKDLKVKNPYVKYAGLLSFASFVTTAYKKDFVDEEQLIQYMKEYDTKFQAASNYDERLNYLLGLINFANSADDISYDFISPIVFNSSESSQLRSLLISRLGDRLLSQFLKEPTKFLDVIYNHSESFEVRIAAVDVLLSKKFDMLSQDQINQLINSYTGYKSCPYERHMQNYIYTTLENVDVNEAIKSKLDAIDELRTDRTWTTGNYFLSYGDNKTNFGASVQAKLVGNPTTNFINTVQIQYENHAMLLTLDKYTVYIKMGGVWEYVFEKIFFDSRTESEDALPILLDLIKKNGYKFKEIQDMEMEVALFCNDRAIFGMKIDENNYYEKLFDNPIYIDLLKLIIRYQAISYPLISYEGLVSDLGTAIIINNQILTMHSHEFTNVADLFGKEDSSHDLTYRSQWGHSMSLTLYNPIDNVDITVYKYLNNIKRIEFPFHVNKTAKELTWIPKKDGFNLVDDRLLGIYVERVKDFCKNCEEYNELPMPESVEVTTTTPQLQILSGIKLNATQTNKTNNMELDEILEIYNSKTNLHPLLKLLCYFPHTNNYLKYLSPDLNRYSIQSFPSFRETIESKLRVLLDLSEVGDSNNATLKLSIVMESKNIETNENVTYVNLNYQYLNEMKNNDHVEDKHEMRLILQRNETVEVCISKNTVYPDRRADKYSIIPLESAMTKSMFSWGTINETSPQCLSDERLIFSTLYSQTEEFIQKVKESDAYKQCKKDTVGLKYTLPTKACLDVFNQISKYNLLKIFIDLKHAERLQYIPFEPELEKNEYGTNLLTYQKYYDGSINNTLSVEFLIRFVVPYIEEFYSTKEVTNILDTLMINPAEESYHEHGLDVGLSSICLITPNQIETFTGKMLSNYDFGNDFVAFVECLNTTQAGMIVHKINDKQIGFTIHQEEDTLTATVDSDHLKLIANGKELKRDHSDTNKMIQFFDDNTVYIIGDTFEIYYNTEYISVKVISLYNDFTCGICSTH